MFELARPFELSVPTVSRHLKVLRRAGLISQRRLAQRRPCRLEFRELNALATWFEPYHQLWEARLRRLDTHLQRLQARERAAHGAKTGN